MTIPTDGQIDLDALAELQAWLLKRARPNSGLRYERYGDGLARVELYGADATFVADHFHSKGAKKLADAIDMAHRSAIPSEGEAVGEAEPHVSGRGWENLTCDDQYALARRIAANVGYVLTPELSIQAAEDASTSLAVVPEGWKLVPIEPTGGMIRAGVDERDRPGSGAAISKIYAAMLSVSPSPPTLDGAGRDAVIEECAKAVRVASEQPIYSGEMRFVAGHRLGVDRSLAAIRALKETP